MIWSPRYPGHRQTHTLRYQPCTALATVKAKTVRGNRRSRRCCSDNRAATSTLDTARNLHEKVTRTGLEGTVTCIARCWSMTQRFFNRLPESYSQHTPRGADYGQPRGPPGDRRGSVSAGTGYGGYRGVETGRNYASYHSGSLGSGGQGGFGRDGAHHGESGQSPHPSYAAPPQPNPAGASVGNWPQRRSDPRMAGRY